MERQTDRLVESIFDRLKTKDQKSRLIPSLFHSSSGTKTVAPPEPQVPFKPSGRRFHLGLDIGSATFRWVQLGLVRQRIEIMEIGQQPLESGAILPEAERKNFLRDQLRQMVSTRALGGAAVLSLPVEVATLRVLKMPVLPEGEMEQAVRWQIEQTLPPQISYDDLAVDFLSLGEMGTLQENRVLISSVPRRRVLELVELVQSAGLQPIAVELDSFSVMTVLKAQRRIPEGQTVLLLDLGAASSSFSVISKGGLSFSRAILTTGRSLTRSIAERLRISADQAEILKRTHGMTGHPELNVAPQGAAGESLSVAQALASTLENLVMDALHSFKDFSHQITQSQIQRFDRLYLSGGTALLPGLAPWLERRLGAPVEILNPSGILPVAKSASVPPSWEEAAVRFSVAMGLALREVPLP